MHNRADNTFVSLDPTARLVMADKRARLGP